MCSKNCHTLLRTVILFSNYNISSTSPVVVIGLGRNTRDLSGTQAALQACFSALFRNENPAGRPHLTSLLTTSACSIPAFGRIFFVPSGRHSPQRARCEAYLSTISTIAYPRCSDQSQISAEHRYRPNEKTIVRPTSDRNGAKGYVLN